MLRGSGSDRLGKILVLSNGHYILLGSTDSNNGDVIGNHGTSDCWVVEIDSVGTLIWQKCYGGSESESGNDIYKISSGFIIYCSTNSNNGNVTGNHGGIDFWIFKIDTSGSMIWQKCFGGSQTELSNGSMLPLSSNLFIICGSTISTDGDITGNHGGYDGWIIKIDSSGNLISQKCYGGSQWDYFSFIVKTITNKYVLSGYTLSNDFDVSGNHGFYDNWVIELDTNSNIQTQKCFGGSDYEAGAIFETFDYGYILEGVTYSNNGDVSGLHGYSDAWIAVLDSNFNLTGEQCFGGTYHDGAGRVIQLSDSIFIMTGGTESDDGDVSGHHGNAPLGTDIWVVKFKTPTGLPNDTGDNIIKFDLKVYPNPVREKLTVKSGITGELIITNMLGQICFSGKQLAGETTTIDVSGFAAAVYFLQLKSNDSLITKKIIVQ